MVATAITTVDALTDLGRVRLSDHFFMRDMLYSEVSNLYGVPNIPEDPDAAVAAGRALCREILEPLRSAFGSLSVRSAYRSPTLNGYCHQRHLAGDAASWCTDNASNAARHIWDRPDAQGRRGATATVFLPGYLPHYERTGDFRPLAWWIRDHVPAYAAVFFFEPLCAFNIRWYEGETDQTIARVGQPQDEVLTRRGAPGFEGDHAAAYAGVIPAIS